jgi:outer membrane protein assembly factor BamD (BamD/ComL family)
VTASSATVAVEGAPAASATHADEAGSTLTAENELYRRAVSSVRGSDDSRAVGLLDTFLVRFPRSPLAQNAEVERLRALERLGRHDAAVHAAQQYLSAYPRGFASEEARRLLAPAGTER